MILYLNIFISATVSVLCPPLLLGLLGNYLTAHLGWDRIVIALFVLLGLAIGAYSGIRYLLKASPLLAKTDADDAQNLYKIENKQNRQ